MDDNHNAAMRIALMGALTGGALGAGGKFLTGATKLKAILKAAGIGAGIGGAAAGATNVAGSALMGEPEEGEANPNTRRGLTGGALLGILGGGALGAAGAAGKIPVGLRSLLVKMGDELPLDNMITRKIGEYGRAPTASGIKKGAAIGAAAVGVPLAYEGMDEGMYYDAMQEELRKAQRKKQIEEMMREQYGV